MLEGSVLVRIWRGSYCRRLIDNLGVFGSRVASGSKIVGLLLGDGPGWLQGSCFGRLVQGGVHWLTGLVQGIRQWLAAAAGESRVLALAAGDNPRAAGFVLSLLLGLGLTLLAGAVVRGGSWWPVAVLLVAATVIGARLWPQRRAIWVHSLTAKLWTKLTAVDD